MFAGDVGGDFTRARLADGDDTDDNFVVLVSPDGHFRSDA